MRFSKSLLPTVAAAEAAGGGGGHDLPVKEHTDQVCVTGAELHIVRYHHNGHAALLQLPQNRGE